MDMNEQKQVYGINIILMSDQYDGTEYVECLC